MILKHAAFCSPSAPLYRPKHFVDILLSLDINSTQIYLFSVKQIKKYSNAAGGEDEYEISKSLLNEGPDLYLSIFIGQKLN